MKELEDDINKKKWLLKKDRHTKWDGLNYNLRAISFGVLILTDEISKCFLIWSPLER